MNNDNTRDGLAGSAHGIEASLANLFENFPHIPDGGRKVIADIAPWLALISGIFGLLGLVTAGNIFSMFGSSRFSGLDIGLIIALAAIALSLIASVFQLLSFNPLREKMKKGWNFLYYGFLLSALSSVLTVAGSMVSIFGSSYVSSYVKASGLSSLIGLVVWFLIGGWLLFEIRKEFRS